MSHRYRLFGLLLESDLPLPDAESDSSTLPADVRVTVRESAEPATFTVPGVARYTVTDGRSIIVAPDRDAPESDVRLFLLGSAMAFVLHQRGLLPLHGCALGVGGRAIVLCGASGAGKSSLAAWADGNGIAVLADDVAVVDPLHDRQMTVCLGPKRMRLTESHLLAARRSTDGLRLSYADTPDAPRKFDVPLQAPRHPLPLGAVFILDWAEQASITPINGIAAADALFANTFRGAQVQEVGRPEDHWRAVMALVGRIPVFRFARPQDRATFDRSATLLIDHAQRIGRP